MENSLVIVQKDTTTLFKEGLEKSMSYMDYRTLVSQHVEKGTASGPKQTEALSEYTRLNDSRMRRLDKTTKISDAVSSPFKNFKSNQTWLVLTESWCGDAAQSMPVMNKLAELSSEVDFKVALRDENPELMNAFLTNGGMSIPKLIVFDNETNQIVGDWGPRPSEATKMVADFKKNHGALTPAFKQDLQVWYNKDKGQNIAEDLEVFAAIDLEKHS